MRIGRHKISESDAISVAVEHLRKKIENIGSIDFSEVQEGLGEWTMKGTYSNEEDPKGENKFRIIIDNKGKVKSASYEPIDTKSYKIAPKGKNCNENQKEENMVSMNDFERTVKKIESLQAAIQQLVLEREKLQKKLKAKAASLEREVKGIKSEIKRIKLLLNQENSVEPSQDLEMQISQ